jgi:fructosamine-3-kinase
MDLNNSVQRKLEELKGSKIVDAVSLSGGCISNAYRITFADKGVYLLKLNEHDQGDMFIKEGHGLQELKKPGAIRVPEVVACDSDFILLEFINSAAKKKNFFEEFGRRFALLHKHTSNEFGFYENNYIGSTPQLNLPDNKTRNNWVSFYFTNRLLFQFRLLEKNGYADSAIRDAFGKLEKKIDLIITESDSPPSLLHGDLWSGNYMSDENGDACLIDPAVYYGHREADLAMTKLFGGFPSAFYNSYNEDFPLPDGWQERENIYMLCHVMNHLNLFGGGYYSHTLSLIRSYL